MAFVLDPDEREGFKRCRRAWDLGSRNRRNLEAVASDGAPDLGRALRDALAVWYFPGMWRWDRAIVRPLVLEGFDDALQRQHDRAAGGREAAWAQARDRGRSLLDDYMEWAPGRDRFTPIRVEAELAVTVPDPAAEGRALRTGGGASVEYRDRLDLVVADDDDVHWIVEHRVGGRAFADPHLLRLDERALAACWAWQTAYLSTPVAGVIHNELLVDPAPGEHRFRRTPVARTRERLRRHLAQVADEVADMGDPDLAVYPHPDPGHCAACSFRAPCRALSETGDAEALLAEAYRPRPDPDESEAGRLGTTTWSMGRGAAPWRFGHR